MGEKHLVTESCWEKTKQILLGKFLKNVIIFLIFSWLNFGSHTLIWLLSACGWMMRKVLAIPSGNSSGPLPSSHLPGFPAHSILVLFAQRSSVHYRTSCMDHPLCTHLLLGDQIVSLLYLLHRLVFFIVGVFHSFSSQGAHVFQPWTPTFCSFCKNSLGPHP